MDDEETCPCDTPEYWEVLKSHFEEQTLLLKGKEQELRNKIAQVECLIASHSSSLCSCVTETEIPKVFPRNNDSPVRDNATKPNAKCSSGFFQKVMENAKSILTMKCSAIHPSNTNEIPTRDSSCACESEERQWTSSSSKGVAFESLPEDRGSYQCLCDEEDTATKNDTTDDSYSQEVNNSFSCSGSCHVNTYGKDDTTISTGECSQYTTNTLSRTPCSLSTGQYTNASMVSCGCPSKKLPEFPDIVTTNKSTVMAKVACQHSSGDKQADEEAVANLDGCWKNPFKCKTGGKSDVSAMASYDTDQKACNTCTRALTDFKNNSPSRNEAPKNFFSRGISPCSANRMKDACCRMCPTTRDTTTSRSPSRKTSPRRNDSAKQTSCRFDDCPKIHNHIDTNTEIPCTVDTCTSLIHQKQNTTSCRMEPFLKPANIASRRSVGIRKKAPCKDSTCLGLRSVSKSFTSPNISSNRRTGKRKSCTIQTVPSKKIRSRSNIRDVDNQCAFVGSPILESSDYKGIGDTKNLTADCSCPTSHDRSPQLEKMMSQLTSKEIGYKNHMKELLKKEKNYDSVFRNVQSTVNKSLCYCGTAQKDNSISDEIRKITDELKFENQTLKGEVLEMKYELKHCIENIEGPIKQKLETERMRCEQLQRNLDQASQDMLGSQDSYLRETNSLKLQLCLACSNMTELNCINKRLKEEMKSLDNMCAKLEEDLLKQKLNEADTIRRLTKRTNVGGAPDFQCTGRKFSCDSNLNVIARKLSRTLKESAPCEECSKLPELTGAAKMIKDLTDMVEKRKTLGFAEEITGNTKDCSCQSRKPTEEDSCQCDDFRGKGAGEYRNFKGKIDPAKMTKTLFPASPTFVEQNESSHLNLKGPTIVAAGAQMSESRYYSAHGEPCFQGTEDPASDITPNVLAKKWPASDTTERSPSHPESKETPAGDRSDCTETGKAEKQQQIPERVTVELESCQAPCENIVAAPCECIGKPCQTEEIEMRDQVECGGEEVRGEPGSAAQDQGDQIPKTSVEAEKEKATSGEDKVAGGEGIPEKKSKGVCGVAAPCEPCIVAGKTCQTDFEKVAPTMEEMLDTIRRESISSAQEAVKQITDALLTGVMPKFKMESDVSGGVLMEEGVTEVEEVQQVKADKSSTQAAKMITDALLDNVSTAEQKSGDGLEPVAVGVKEPDAPEEQIEPVAVIKESIHQPEEEQRGDGEGVDSKPSKEEEQIIEQGIEKVVDSEPSNLGEQTQQVEESIEQVIGSEPSDVKEELPKEDIIDKEIDNELPDIKLQFEIAEEQELPETSPHLDEVTPSTPSPTADIADTPVAQEQQQQFRKGKLFDSHAPGELISEELQEGFPFEVETTVAALAEPPPGLIVTTTITNSGNLEVITEGPNGIIETTLNYTEDGVIEVITQITEVEDQDTLPTETDVTNTAISEELKPSKPKSTAKRSPGENLNVPDGDLDEMGFEYPSEQENSSKSNELPVVRKNTSSSMITQYSHSICEDLDKKKSHDTPGEDMIAQETTSTSSKTAKDKENILSKTTPIADAESSSATPLGTSGKNVAGTTPKTSTYDSNATPGDIVPPDGVSPGQVRQETKGATSEHAARSGQDGTPLDQNASGAFAETVQGARIPIITEEVDDTLEDKNVGKTMQEVRSQGVKEQVDAGLTDGNTAIEQNMQGIRSQGIAKPVDDVLADGNFAIGKTMEGVRSQGVTEQVDDEPTDQNVAIEKNVQEVRSQEVTEQVDDGPTDQNAAIGKNVQEVRSQGVTEQVDDGPTDQNVAIGKNMQGVRSQGVTEQVDDGPTDQNVAIGKNMQGVRSQGVTEQVEDVLDYEAVAIGKTMEGVRSQGVNEQVDAGLTDGNAAIEQNMQGIRSQGIAKPVDDVLADGNDAIGKSMEGVRSQGVRSQGVTEQVPTEGPSDQNVAIERTVQGGQGILEESDDATIDQNAAIGKPMEVARMQEARDENARITEPIRESRSQEKTERSDDAMIDESAAIERPVQEMESQEAAGQYRDAQINQQKSVTSGSMEMVEDKEEMKPDKLIDTIGSAKDPGMPLDTTRSADVPIGDEKTESGVPSVDAKESRGAVPIDGTRKRMSQEGPASEGKTEEADESTNIISENEDSIFASTKKALPCQNKHDCACQSSPLPIEQSCQCCECKDIAVSTSQDTETLTDTNMAIEKLSVNEATDTNTQSNYATADINNETVSTKAEALSLDAEKTQGTSDEISTINDKLDTDGGEAGTGPAIKEVPTSKTDIDGGIEILVEKSGVAENSDDTTSSVPQPEDEEQSAVSKAGEVSAMGDEEVEDRGEGAAPPTSSTLDNDKKQESSTASKKSSEVPDSVSKLSDKDNAPAADGSDTSRPRKRRSSKLENVICDCEGVCQCVVCSPEIISRRMEMTGNSEPPIGESDQLCCCSVQSSQSHPQTTCPANETHMQTRHNSSCKCPSCKLESCRLNSTKFKTEAFLRSTNLDSAQGAIPKTKKRTCLDDIFNPPCQIPADCWKSLKKSTQEHSADCECIDCLCLPKIQKIAQMKEFPVVKDEKQIYQVTTMKCTCINSISARKYLAEKSRIPIATNSTTVGPPKIKPPVLADCICDDCDCCPGDCNAIKEGITAAPSKAAPIKSETGQDNTGQGPKIRLTPSQLAKMCDCAECECKVCFNKPAESQEVVGADKPLSARQSKMDKGAHPELCECSECQCKVCFNTPIKREPDGNAAVDAKQSRVDKEEEPKQQNQKNCCCKGECACAVCPVDALQAKPSTMVPKDQGVTPTVSKVVSIAPSAVSRGDECDCQECVCPNAAALKTAPEISIKASQLPSATSKASQLPAAASKASQLPAAASVNNKVSSLSHSEDCDCEVCNCPLSSNMNKVAKEAGDMPSHPDDCDCTECVDCALSPGKVAGTTAKPSQYSTAPGQITSAKPSQMTSAKPSQMMSAKPSQIASSDCKCDLCKCTNVKESQAKGDQSQKPSAIMPPSSEAKLPMECDCVDCECDPCADPKKVKSQKSVPKQVPCDCADCKCNPCADPSKRTPQQTVQNADLDKGDATMPDALTNCTCEICGCPGKDQGTTTLSNVPHPDDCDCVDCTCAEEVMQTASEFSHHPDACNCIQCECPGAEKGARVVSQGEEGCNCDVCSCPGKDKIKIVGAPVVSTGNKEGFHPEGCNCDTCECPGDQPGSKTDKATHPLGCTCADCACEDCFHKNERVRDDSLCKCGNCLCKDCSKMELTGDKVRPTPAEEIKADRLIDQCACGECVCLDCFHKKEKFEVKDCKCGVCMCHECQFSVQTQESKKQDASVPAVTTRSCHCIDCTCDVCSKADRNKKIDTPNETAKPAGTCHCIDCECDVCAQGGKKMMEPVKTGGHPDGCTCMTCLCIECFGKMRKDEASDGTKAESSAAKAKGDGTAEVGKGTALVPAAASSSRSPNCRCLDCVCEDCCGQDSRQILEPVTQICHCDGCKCDDCCNQKSQAVPAQAVPTQVVPAQAVPGSSPIGAAKGYSCICTECKGDCLKEGPSGSACHCPGCECDDCRKAKTPAKPLTTSSSDPPRFEVPIRIDCDCNTCSCVICEQKKPLASAMAGSTPTGITDPTGITGPTGRTTPATAEAPPFEVPVRLPCSCPVCTCAVCNKEGDQAAPSSGYGASAASGRSAAVAATTPPSTLEAPPFDVPYRLRCNCVTCTCTHCNKEGGQIPPPPGVGVQKSFALADKKSAAVGVPCSCTPCACIEDDKRGNQPVTIQQSNVPIQSTPMIPLTKSAPIPDRPNSAPVGNRPQSPVHCDCPTCTCPETSVNFYAGKFESNANQPLSNQRIMGTVSNISGKQSEKLVANHQPLMSQVPCNCPTCICSGETILKQNITEKVSRVTYKEPTASEKMLGEPTAIYEQIKVEAQTSRVSGKQSEPSPGPISAHMSTISGKQSEKNNTPIPCNCPECSCPGERTRVGVQTSRISGKQSEPAHISAHMSTISGKKSEPSPISAPMSTISGKKSEPSPISAPMSTITGKQSEPSPGPISAHVSTISGKQSEKNNTPIPCNCPECSCPGERTRVGVQASRISGKQSEPSPISAHMSTISGKKSEPSPISAHISTISGNKSEKVISVHQTGSPGTCDCVTCNCPEESINYYAGKFVAGVASAISGKQSQITGKQSQITGKQSQITGKPSAISGKVSTVAGDPQPAAFVPSRASKMERTVENDMPEKDVHSDDCNCPECCICPIRMGELDIAKMDNDALKKEIQSTAKENCECREQIKEIKRALNQIKCACTEAEMKAVKNKPLVKQASAFGQTMSGLKLALNNLQDKCKAKDKMIDVMTGELKMRTSSNTFEKVLNTRMGDAPDYDKAEDVKYLEKSGQDPVSTNILYPVEEEKGFAEKMSKAMVNEKTHRSRKKSSRTCGCGKPHKEKDNVKLVGFEVIDIRRITQDSIIVKWKPPKSSSVTGYDIFINGVNKSKVMSGGRTSAMIHSLDLSATIQVTIYAVTKCGRCEPPAIAIYEIRN